MLVRIILALAILTPQKAAPPEWPQEVLDVFFDDARQQLVGKRPATHTAETRLATAAKINPVVEQATDWSDLIKTETLRAEVKRLNNSLARSIASASQFKSGGNRECRRVFAELAVLFAVIAEYGDDSEVRWQKGAPGLRNAFSRAARNCQKATDESFNDARLRHENLNKLLRGQAVLSSGKTESIAWDSLAERSQLMLRMELAVKEQLSSSLGSAAAFRKKTQQLRHEAQVLAMLAEVIQRESYEFADDDTYLEYSRELREAAQQLDRACLQKDYQRAREAVGRATQSCSECHDGYRG